MVGAVASSSDQAQAMLEFLGGRKVRTSGEVRNSGRVARSPTPGAVCHSNQEVPVVIKCVAAAFAWKGKKGGNLGLGP